MLVFKVLVLGGFLMSISRTNSFRNPNLIFAINPVVLESVHVLLSNKLNY